MKVRNILATAVITGSGMMLSGGVAIADPDPHMPYLEDGYCGDPLHPNDPKYRGGYCGGTPYPDGTKWMYSRSITDPNDPGKLTCVKPNLTRFPPPAPPGGCGGAWQD